MEVRLHEVEVEDNLLEYAVIISRYHNQWVFCRHKQRTTYEIPGGHREKGESIYEAAKRELTEETGALEFEIQTLCDYSVQSKDEINYGRVFVANIALLGELPDSEIGEVIISKELPEKWTYPEIQKKFIEKYIEK
jgi:8-oxo-dGTP diphosphatase